MLIKENNQGTELNKILIRICVILIWAIYLYSSIIQYKYYIISNGMLYLGAAILVVYLLLLNGQDISLETLLAKECKWMLFYMLYMLAVGSVVATMRSSHLSQWITSMEYLFILLVIVNIIGWTGTNTFQWLLLAASVWLGVILLRQPILYTTSRYSISKDLNPNYLGMCFTAGIWAALFFQQKGKISLLLTFPIALFLTYCIIQTGSRKALIAAGLELILWLFFCLFSNIRNNTVWEKVINLIVCAALAVFAVRLFVTEYIDSSIAQRMSNLQSETGNGERLGLYRTGWELFIANPIFGSGYSSFMGFRGEHSHATFIEVPVSGGILGTVLYFASYVASIRRCWQIKRVCQNDDSLRDELAEVRMILVLWAVMIFYCTCIIHPHQFLSYISFGIIFGKTVYLQHAIEQKKKNADLPEMRSSKLNGKSIYIKG